MREFTRWTVLGAMLALALALLAREPRRAQAHDIYSRLYSPKGQLCCSGSSDGQTGDCAPTLARQRADGVDYLVLGKEWVHVPSAHVTFLPVPGQETQKLQEAPDGLTWAHFCGVRPSQWQSTYRPQDIFDGWLVYCAFFDPSGT